ncbi:nucleoside phosphatase GDA1/CD39 [Gaertneriomyces semiglobifer]|nr:nucleoside phosphatase GDA1/CD39 [Gaertneriomyces semiglobifer]
MVDHLIHPGRFINSLWNPTTACHPAKNHLPTQYAIVVDAGSTGSRIHVYSFNYCGGGGPSLEHELFRYVTPGLSSPIFETPTDAAASLDPLLRAAVDTIPKKARGCAPITVKATAGLRMLKDGKGDLILDAVRHKLETQYPFPIMEPNGVEVMPGKEEGVYAWITVNYLLKKIGQPQRLPTAAIMDLGGGSTQIVFEPNSQTPMEPGDHRYELKFGDFTYILYQHSYDGYGLMQGRHRVKTAGIASQSFPCYAVGHTEEYVDDDGVTHTIEGMGQRHDECHAFIGANLFSKDTCPAHIQDSCSFAGVYQPSIATSFADNDIYAFSYFYDKFAEPFGMASEPGFSVGDMRKAAEKVCAGDVSIIESLPNDAQKEAAKLFKDPEWCTDLGFMYGLLSVGYAIPDQRVLKTAKKIDGVETGWSLGAALNMAESWGKDGGSSACLKELD